MKFEKETLLEILGGDSEEYEKVSDEITDNSRWSIHHYMIFKDSKGNFYGVDYTVGATESQDESPWEYDGDEIEVEELREAYSISRNFVGKDSPETAFEKTMTDFDKVLYRMATEDIQNPDVMTKIQLKLLEVFHGMEDDVK